MDNLAAEVLRAEQLLQQHYLSAACGLDVHRRFGAHLPGVYLETCPHYLLLDKDAAIGSLAKVNPPVRTPADQEALWGAIAAGEAARAQAEAAAPQGAPMAAPMAPPMAAPQ